MLIREGIFVNTLYISDFYKGKINRSHVSPTRVTFWSKYITTGVLI